MSGWEPAIGQRVRVLPRPTCRYCQEDDAGSEDGAVGVIVQVGHGHADDLDGGSEAEAAFNAHSVWVRLDSPAGEAPWRSPFMPNEIEPA
jgi:hypothetical protein